MSAAGDYTGFGFCGVDSKQRYTLPVEFRHRVRAGSEDNTLVIRIPDGEPCMYGFGKDHLSLIKGEIEADASAARERGETFDRHGHALAAAEIETVAFDDGGRFAFDADLKALLGLGDALVFIGAFWQFEIWDARAYIASGRANQRNLLRARNSLAQWEANPKNPNRGAQ